MLRWPCLPPAAICQKDDDSTQSVAPGNEDPLRYRARYIPNSAPITFQRGQMSVALEELREAVRLTRSTVLAHSVLGLVHADLGEFAKADAAFSGRHRPGRRRYPQQLRSYLCRQGRPKEGLEQFDAALRLPLYQTPRLRWKTPAVAPSPPA